ncbi:MAG: 2OG-Fe(II) oxygenase [Bdellovibrionales bacterium]|nr:2OG-Fe(II) oxygenase [Bdellovibrionales bacterium]
MKKEMLIDSLVDKGWFHQENFLDSNYCLELIKEAQNLSWTKAQIGRQDLKQEALAIRNDSIFWIDEEKATPLQKTYIELMKDLTATLNRELFLNIREFECHFAKYDTAGFYKKHLDQHLGSNSRLVSTIFYLNRPANGGELVIYERENPDKIAAKISPKAGSFVCFLSNQIYHEVLPTEGERLSLTGWFRSAP